MITTGVKISETRNSKTLSSLSKPFFGKSGGTDYRESTLSPAAFFIPHPVQSSNAETVSNSLQRKCTECEKEDEKKIQTKNETGAAGKIVAPPVVSDVINSPGQSLDNTTKSFIESRMGYDFGNVQIHNDPLSHQSAAGINALAYTHGNHVVFGKGQYQPGTDEGKKLLAHELTHVIQQDRIGQRRMIQRFPAPPTVTPRGTNPGDCMGAICQRLNSMRSPGSVAGANTIVDNWLADSISCLHTHAPNSNASHQQEIAQNAEAELRSEAANSRSYITQIRHNASGFRDFIEDLRRICERKQREISIEFRYNIVLDNSGLFWGYSPATDWDAIETAFAGLPAESTWLSPRLLTFRRESVHATNPNVAGETDPQTATITIFDQGFGNLPYGRSNATGIPATSQTIQHEVGHIMTNLIPRSDYNDFFNNILHWHTYPWAWITAPGSPHPNWQAERSALITETGMTSAQLDTWLGTLPMNARTNRNNRSYFRSSNFLEAYDMDQVPTIRAFEYAASNKDDYLSELYTFCSSSPEFVHANLPQRQIVWLKTSVFHTPATVNELMRMYALNQPQQTEFVLKASRKFTWEQIDNVWQQVIVRNRSAAGELA